MIDQLAHRDVNAAAAAGVRNSQPEGIGRVAAGPPELALLLGAYAAEGHTSRRTYTVTITNSVEAVLERVVAAWKSEFGLDARITREPGKCPGVVVSET